MRLQPLSLIYRLTSTYWFLPAVLTLSAVGLGVGATNIDRAYPDATSWLGWAYGGGADGARALLSAIAGSTITVVSVTFSVLVVALTVSSQHFGPRLLSNFMRDTTSQFVLGTFTGTFAYCLVVLRTVQGDGGTYSQFVPHLAVTMAVLLTLFSVGMLIYYVHHVANSMQVSEITVGVARDLERAVDRLYPERIGAGAEPPPAAALPLPPDAWQVCARRSEYVQEIDSDRVFALACEHRTTVWLTSRPGDFVVEGIALAHAAPAPADPEAFARGLREAYVFGADRTSRQDAAFAVQQLVEVALRALSPGMNEPFTATTCIDRLTQGLMALARRRIPAPMRTDSEGSVRVVAEPRSFGTMLGMAFEPIAIYADRNTPVACRLLESLRLLAATVRREEDREAVGRTADFVWATARDAIHSEHHRAELARLRADVQEALAVG